MPSYSRRKRALSRLFWILLYNVGFGVGILAGTEYASLIVNERAGEAPRPFMIDVDQLRRPSIERPQTGGTTKSSYPDAPLGYPHEPAHERELGDGTGAPWDAGFVWARIGCPVGTGDDSCDAADANGDGEVDPLDTGFVLARFGDCD